MTHGHGAFARVDPASWVTCASCSELFYRPDIEAAAWVCPRCGYLFRLTATQRIELALDAGSFAERDAFLALPAAPAGGDPYPAEYRRRLDQARAKTGLAEALVSGSGTIGGVAVEVVVADFAFLGASMGVVHGEKVVRACGRAVASRAPLVIFAASGGARMQEGMASLQQMARTTVAVLQVRAAGVPFVCVLTDPCYGGVSASYANLADVVLGEARAAIGFAGPRVIAQIHREALPRGFQSAEFHLQHGMLDAVVDRAGLRPHLVRLLTFFQRATEY